MRVVRHSIRRGIGAAIAIASVAAAIFACARAAGAATVVLAVPADTTFEAGAIVRLPVRTAGISLADGITAMQMKIVYPANLLAFRRWDRGPILPSDGMPATNATTPGVFVIAWAGQTNIISGDGTLLTVEFVAINTFPDGTWGPVAVTKLDGGVPLFESDGPDPLVEIRNGIVRVHNPLIPSAIAGGNAPAAMTLRAWPNPFNAEVAIALSAASATDRGAWAGSIVDLNGRVVRRWTMDAPGRWVWDARDDAGRAVGGGVYLAMLSRGERRLVVRLALAR